MILECSYNYLSINTWILEFCQQFFSTVISAGKNGSFYMVRTRSADDLQHSVKPPCKLSLGHFCDQGFFYRKFISCVSVSVIWTLFPRNPWIYSKYSLKRLGSLLLIKTAFSELLFSALEVG